MRCTTVRRQIQLTCECVQDWLCVYVPWAVTSTLGRGRGVAAVAWRSADSLAARPTCEGTQCNMSRRLWRWRNRAAAGVLVTRWMLPRSPPRLSDAIVARESRSIISVGWSLVWPYKKASRMATCSACSVLVWLGGRHFCVLCCVSVIHTHTHTH